MTLFAKMAEIVRSVYANIPQLLEEERAIFDGVWREYRLKFVVPKVKEALLRRRLQRRWDRVVGDYGLGDMTMGKFAAIHCGTPI